MVHIEEEELNNGDFLVKVKDLPAFNELKTKIDRIVRQSGWIDRHGKDNGHFALGCMFYTFGFVLVTKPELPYILTGILSIGLGHTILAAKVFHSATHGAMGETSWYNTVVAWFTGDFLNSFPAEGGMDTHIKGHHPHTNIIGMGDSSIWKVPMLPGWLYLFVAPMLLPVATPIVGLQLVYKKPLHRILWFVISAILGYIVSLHIMHYYCGYTWFMSLVILLVSRATFTVSYIHINIFQHIGLPMYSKDSRPARLFQMTSGVLNLKRNPILDLAFGHSLVNCHVEHHLFPQLSDAMCMKIKPHVSQFLIENDLPYHEDYYGNRLKMFFHDYTKLMVNAPPIWHYVGLQ